MQCRDCGQEKDVVKTVDEIPTGTQIRVGNGIYQQFNVIAVVSCSCQQGQPREERFAESRLVRLISN
jgi:hypothetical protein